MAYSLILGVMTETSFILLVTYALCKNAYVDENRIHPFDLKRYLIMILAFSISGIVTTHYLGVSVGDQASINMIDVPAMFAGLIGGPIVGLPTGILIGLDRYLVGDASALACALGPIIASILGSIMWYVLGKKYPVLPLTVLLMCFSEMLHIIMVIFFSSEGRGSEISHDIAVPMVLCNVVCIAIISYIYRTKLRDVMRDNNRYRKFE